MIRVVNVTASNLRKLGLSPEQVCYVARSGRFHKWQHHPLANPFNHSDIKYRHWNLHENAVRQCLADYRQWLKGMSLKELNDALDELWAECDQGAKPLGCWCCDSVHGDGQPITCHAQILAGELHRRFVEGNAS